MYVDVAEESPTVKGIIGILHQALDGAPLSEVGQFPNDLIRLLKLQNQIRMNRAVGVNAIVNRIKNEVARAIAGENA